MNIFKKIYNYRELLKTNVKKEIRGRYKNSILGVMWSFLNPLLQLLVYSVIFGALLTDGSDSYYQQTYYIYVCVALIPWTYFTTAVTQSAFTVIGNGDITDEESAKRMFEYTGADGIMIGRGAIGNPWIFEQIQYYLKTGNKLQRPSNEEKYNVLKQHIELCIKEKGEKIAINEMRKHIAYYTKNLKDASSFRVKVNKIDNKKELIETLEKFFL